MFNCLTGSYRITLILHFVLKNFVLILHSHIDHDSLLLRRECCSFSNGEYVKAGLAELEHWCYKATDEVTQLISYDRFHSLTSNTYT